MLLAFPVVLFPALADDIFEHPQLLGLLYSAETVGALLATLLSGWTARVHHHGRAIVVAAAAYGLFIGLVGLAPTIGVALGLPGPGRRRRHDLRGLPRHGLEPDHPRAHARPSGGHRDAVVLGRPDRRPGALRPGGRPVVGARRRSPAAASPASSGSASRPSRCATSGGTTPAPTSTPSPSASSGRPAGRPRTEHHGAGLMPTGVRRSASGVERLGDRLEDVAVVLVLDRRDRADQLVPDAVDHPQPLVGEDGDAGRPCARTAGRPSRARPPRSSRRPRRRGRSRAASAAPTCRRHVVERAGERLAAVLEPRSQTRAVHARRDVRAPHPHPARRHRDGRALTGSSDPLPRTSRRRSSTTHPGLRDRALLQVAGRPPPVDGVAPGRPGLRASLRVSSGPAGRSRAPDPVLRRRAGAGPRR